MKIGIIGAGVTGLVAAWRLAQQGHQVTVLETRTEAGGLVAGISLQSEHIERIYHHIFTSDSYVLSLIKEIGLSDQLVWMSPKSGLYIRNRLYPFSSPLHLMMFEELPLLQRIRLGLLVLRARFIRNWKPMESIKAKDWLIRYAGRKAYEVLWEPLIRSKFDTDADDISAVWIWNKFKLRGSTRGTTPGEATSSEAFGYLLGGFTQLYDCLVEKIRALYGVVHFGTEVNRISKTEHGKILVGSSQRESINQKNGFGQMIGSNQLHDSSHNESEHEDEFDLVLFTGAPAQLLKVVSFSSEPASPIHASSYVEQCANLRYKANLCLLLTLTSSLSPYYWTTVADDTIPFVLVIEHTQLITNRSYGGTVVYLSRYLDESNPLFSKSDEEITALFLEGLKKMYPAFSLEMVRSVTFTRERYAQPVVSLDYESRMPSLQTPIPGLFLASMAQIYPEDRGQNYAIRLAEDAVACMNNGLQ